MVILCSLLMGAGLGASAVYCLLDSRIDSYRTRNQDLRHQLNDMQQNFGDRLHDSLSQQRFDYESEIKLLKGQLFRAKFRANSKGSAPVDAEAKAS